MFYACHLQFSTVDHETSLKFIYLLTANPQTIKTANIENQLYLYNKYSVKETYITIKTNKHGQVPASWVAAKCWIVGHIGHIWGDVSRVICVIANSQYEVTSVSWDKESSVIGLLSVS